MVTVRVNIGFAAGEVPYSRVDGSCRYDIVRLEDMTGRASGTGMSSGSDRSRYARAVFDRDRGPGRAFRPWD